MRSNAFPPSLMLHALMLAALFIVGRECRAEGENVYRQGSDFAGEIKKQGVDTLKMMNPADTLPNYTDRPPEKSYYGGVRAKDTSRLKNDGANAWAGSEAGKTVNDTFMNRPKDALSHDAPFIQAGEEMRERADSVVGKTGPDCQAQEVSRSTFTNYVCERDTRVEEYCTRTSTITGDWRDDETWRDVTVPPSAFRFSLQGKRLVFSVEAPVTGTIESATLTVYSQWGLDNARYTFLNSTIGAGREANATKSHALTGAAGMQVTEGQVLTGSGCSADGRCSKYPRVDADFYKGFGRGLNSFTLSLRMKVADKKWVPRVEWAESCPFDKSQGVLVSSECTEPGGEKTGIVDGKTWRLTQACWAWRDKYATQSEDAGTCQKYRDNPACTVATQQCAFNSEEDGACLHENVTYSCETRRSGKMMMCGGQMYCLDGECDQQQKGTQGNDFGHAVSVLAAVAAAGKDVSELNGVDVRAFTGHKQTCRKSFAGFSNCCRDSGWGNSTGLAHCNDEEKALGKAKENRLTVSVGEFCAKKVMGVCLQKKRSYCQFDSKLAQIVQQQGRAWQLGIGFGKARHPDCRGITVDELQRINFDGLDFTNFYEDLLKNQKVPDDAALVEKVKEQITQRMQETGK